MIVAVLTAYSVSRTTFLKYARKLSVPAAIVVLIARSRGDDKKMTSVLVEAHELLLKVFKGQTIPRLIEDVIGKFYPF